MTAGVRRFTARSCCAPALLLLPSTVFANRNHALESCRVVSSRSFHSPSLSSRFRHRVPPGADHGLHLKLEDRAREAHQVLALHVSSMTVTENGAPFSIGVSQRQFFRNSIAARPWVIEAPGFSVDAIAKMTSAQASTPCVSSTSPAFRVATLERNT